MSEQIDWSKAPEGCIGVFTPKLSVARIGSIGFRSFFVITKRYSDYGAQAGCSGEDQDGKEYHVFEKYWDYHEKPASWSGEGLPPVGVVCEYRVCDGPWYKCEIRYTVKRPDGGVIAYCQHLDHEQALYAPYCCFRPIRTPEQIAADEREAAVNGMLCYDALGGSRRGLAEALYDAGYRKP